MTKEISENWDDDFEFQVEKKMSAAATETWDDFEDSPRKAVRRRSWDEDEEDENSEFGLFAEQDRTVTARSRRMALARLSTPLPPLPPRSPTSSVFSVPTTIHTYSSTTHLRATSAFALIPPSPPIHKERARRRLRKKSRPKPQGVLELVDVTQSESFHSTPQRAASSSNWFFRSKSGGGGSPIPPVPYSALASASQVSLRIPSPTNSQRYTSPTISAADLRRAASLSSPRPTSSSTAIARYQSGSTSRPPSPSSAKRRRRTLSKSRPKSRKSEESQHLRDNRIPKDSTDFQREYFEETDITIPKTPTQSTSAATAAVMVLVSQPPPAALLPPIDLQPPSPPRTATKKKHTQRRFRAYTTNEFVEGLELESMPSASSSPAFCTRNNVGGNGGGGILPLPPLSPNKLSPGRFSQQSVSLGRSTAVNVGTAAGGDDNVGLSLASNGAGGLARRNSLGDLKIPARISQAQVGLRRDLGLVREFASNVEQLKELQITYNALVVELQAVLDTHTSLYQRAQPQVETPLPPLPAVLQPISTNFFTQLKSRPKIRARSNTNPTASATASTPIPGAAVDSSSQTAYKSLVEMFRSMNSKYKIPWECAELLIELGSGNAGGDGGVMSAPPTTSVSAPVIQQGLGGGGGGDDAGDGIGKLKGRGRERAITLAGDESKPSTTPTTLPTIHSETHQTQVQSQPSSSVVSISGSSSMPGGMHPGSSSSAGPPVASPPTMSWRASTGRHDLSQRQLVLLREMLNNNNNDTGVVAALDVERPPPPPLPVGEDPELRPAALSPYCPSRSQHVNRDWRWGDARNSTITLEVQEGGLGVGAVEEEGERYGKTMEKEKEKKRRSGRLRMSGIRDMLRSLKKSHVEEEVQSGQQQQHHPHHHEHLPLALPMHIHSTTSLSTESLIASKSVHRQAQAQPQQQPQQQRQNRLLISRIPSQIRRRGRSSTGPELMRLNKGPSLPPFTPSSFTAPKSSPRRPSLASIFRMGGGNNNKTRPISSGGVVHTRVSVVVQDQAATSERRLSAAQGSSSTDNNSTCEEEEEDWDRMDSASDLDAAVAVSAAKALGIADGAYDVSATVRGRNKRKTKGDETKTGVSPYLRHQSSYESDHRHNPPRPSLPVSSSSSTGLGGFLARHSIIPKRSFSASQSSIWGSGGTDGQQQHSPSVPSCLSRHSNFEEQQPAAPLHVSSSKSTPTTTAATKLPHMASVDFVSNSTGTPSQPFSRSTKLPGVKTGSVRSMPAHLVTSSLLASGFLQDPSSPLLYLPDPKLAAMIMTPENIKPLLENAKEVHAKLLECVAEIRALIEDGATAVGVKSTAQAVPLF